MSKNNKPKPAGTRKGKGASGSGSGTAVGAYPSTPLPGLDVQTPAQQNIFQAGAISAAPGSPGGINEQQKFRILNHTLAPVLESTVQENNKIKLKHAEDQQAFVESRSNLESAESKASEAYKLLRSSVPENTNVYVGLLDRQYQYERSKTDSEELAGINRETMDQLQALVRQKQEEFNRTQEEIEGLSGQLETTRSNQPLTLESDASLRNIRGRKEEIAQREVARLSLEAQAKQLAEKHNKQKERITGFDNMDPAEYWTNYHNNKARKELEEYKETQMKESELRIQKHASDRDAYHKHIADRLQQDQNDVDACKADISKFEHELAQIEEEAKQLQIQLEAKRAEVLGCEQELVAEKAKVSKEQVLQTEKRRELEDYKSEEKILTTNVAQRAAELDKLKTAVADQRDDTDKKKKAKEEELNELEETLKELKKQARSMNVDLNPELTSYATLVELAQKNAFPPEKTPTHRSKRFRQNED